MRLSEEELALLLGKPGYEVVGAPPAEPSTPPEMPEGVLGTDAMPEGVLLGKIRRLALDNGFVFYHTHDSRRSDQGYLDCTIAKPGHPLYIWELKTQHGKLTLEQQRWLAFLAQGTGVQAACYRPSDLPIMTALLTQRSTPNA